VWCSGEANETLAYRLPRHRVGIPAATIRPVPIAPLDAC